jgi:hypothetical protein
MALEIRYVPMLDESDATPKIFRVVYDENNKVVASSVSDYKEAAAAEPACIEVYFDLLRDHFSSFSAFIDAKTAFDREVYFKMVDMRNFVGFFFNNYDFDILNDE